MDVRHVGGLGVPAEGAVREPYTPAVADDWFEQGGNGHSLGDAVRGDERELRGRLGEVLAGLAVPSGGVVEVSVVVLAPDDPHVLGLVLALQVLADEGRVAHDVVAPVAGQEFVPVVAQGVGAHDVAVVVQGQAGLPAHDRVGLVEGLLLGDPQRRPGDGHGEVVDLDAVELADAHLDGVEGVAQVEHPVVLVQLGDHAVLEAAQAQVRLGQEVAGPAGRVEELQACEAVLVVLQVLFVCAVGDGLVLDPFKLGGEPVEEEGVDDAVDVPDGGVVHAALAPLVVAEGLLHERAEDDGADAAPVESAGCLEERVADGVGELGDLDPLRVQAAVDVGKRLELVVQVRVAVPGARVERVEQVDQAAAQVRGVLGLDELAERVRGEQPGVLRVHGEHEAHGEHGEVVVHLRGLLAPALRVAFHERVVQPGDAHARVHRQLLLEHEPGVLLVEDAVERAHVVGEVLEAELGVRAVVGAGVLVQVVDAERAEVAGAQRARLLAGGHVVGVAQRLLHGRNHLALAGLRLVEVDAVRLLLDEEPGVGEQRVDEPAVGRAAFELDLGRGVGDVQHAPHQVDPEPLRLLFLVAVPLPPVDEFGDALAARCARPLLRDASRRCVLQDAAPRLAAVPCLVRAILHRCPSRVVVTGP